MDIVEIHKRREPGQSAARFPSRPVAVLVWVIGAAAVGFVIWVIYLFQTSPLFPDCGAPGDFMGGEYSGGAAAPGSQLTALAVGGSLWFLGGVLAFWLRRKLLLLFGGFVAAYFFALIVLWHVSPVIWGPRICS
jgi:hypothetical protein